MTTPATASLETTTCQALVNHEQVLITAYRKLDHQRRQIIWCLLHHGMQQQGLTISFNNQGEK
ncbi:MAG: hypothetical protein JRG71_14550 [Deltaproteobacteria bacterium]|nr:hypothetical protein [Deltaproteobacteria bacterium]